jgi:LytS/YehU family sensor histidine kinase
MTSKFLLKEQEDLLIIKQEMLALKLKVLNSQLNPHFIFNVLNAIQSFITSENKKLALEYFSVFSKFIRFYLNHFEKETVKLEDEIAMLKGYLKLQNLRYDNQFQFILKTSRTQNKISSVIPSFILQTLFENIIEHGIYNQHKNHIITTIFKISKSKVTVDLSYTFDTNNDRKNIYAPEYRERMIKWQDQIRLLNTLKNYKIEKKVTLHKNSKLHGGNVFLTLPNLV